ncbi:TIR domain-containing protein, partial [Actinocorallia lasiicapitis]
MRSEGMSGPQQGGEFFFISYSPADEAWATWMAWELEAAGHRTLLQVWDFVPGTNFIDFMDRAVREATVMIAILSDTYLRSRYGRTEWQAALRSDVGNRLIPVRIEECRLDGLLASITYVDLVGIRDGELARNMLIQRINAALTGRAKPAQRQLYPHDFPAPPFPALREEAPEPVRHRQQVRPDYPGVAAESEDTGPDPRSELVVLHLPGPGFGGPGVPLPAELQATIMSDLEALRASHGVPRPDLVVIDGGLTATGSRREADICSTFLQGLRELLRLEPQRFVIVPGERDVSRAACRAYFNNCEADDVAPQPPYWQKWRYFEKVFKGFYQGLDSIGFEASQPWSLFVLPELRVVVAGLNSTMAISHRAEDRDGRLGAEQTAWFAEQLRKYQDEGWLRLGVMSHEPGADAATGLADAAAFADLVGPRLHLLFHGGATG